MRFGRLSRQLDIQRNQRIINMVETTSGRPVPEDLKAPLLRGMDEPDLVQSGLEDTMRETYGTIREKMLGSETIKDLRTAAFAVALEKVVRSYRQMGLAKKSDRTPCDWINAGLRLVRLDMLKQNDQLLRRRSVSRRPVATNSGYQECCSCLLQFVGVGLVRGSSAGPLRISHSPRLSLP